jgi:hypothetical protein
MGIPSIVRWLGPSVAGWTEGAGEVENDGARIADEGAETSACMSAGSVGGGIPIIVRTWLRPLRGADGGLDGAGSWCVSIFAAEVRGSATAATVCASTTGVGGGATGADAGDGSSRTGVGAVATGATLCGSTGS